MKRLSLTILTSVIAIISTVSVFAGGDAKNDRERKQWFNEMRRYKAEYVAKELGLTDEQKSKFVPLYEEMDANCAKIGDEARKMEKDLTKKDNITDTEYEKAAEALYEAKSKEAALELEYFKKFKTILTKKQLFELKGAERKFTRKLMDHQRKPGKKEKK